MGSGEMITTHTNIIIVGASIEGLVLARALERYDVDVRLLEAEKAPAHEPKALLLYARTLELLDSINLAKPLMETGAAYRSLEFNYEGKKIFTPAFDFLKKESYYPLVLSMANCDMQRVLRRALLKTSVEWGTRITHLKQNGLKTEAIIESNNMDERVVADYIVGADGIESAVRQLAAIKCKMDKGSELMMADVQTKQQLTNNAPTMTFNKRGIMFAVDLPGHQARVMMVDRGKPNARRENTEVSLQELYQKITGHILPMQTTVNMQSKQAVFHQAKEFRAGDVFLVGEAAHAHHPMTSQSVNLGIQDSINLSWKLGMVCVRACPETLLDSYEAERLPVAKKVNRTTDWTIRSLTVHKPVAVQARDRTLKIVEMIERLPEAFIRRLSHLSVRYRASAPALKEELRREGVLRPGDRVPDAVLTDFENQTTRLYEHLQEGKFLFVMRTSGSRIDKEYAFIKRWLRKSAPYFGDMVQPALVAPTPTMGQPDDILCWSERYLSRDFRRLIGPGESMLVRPDGYLLFHSDDAGWSDWKDAVELFLAAGAEWNLEEQETGKWRQSIKSISRRWKKQLTFSR